MRGVRGGTAFFTRVILWVPQAPGGAAPLGYAPRGAGPQWASRCAPRFSPKSRMGPFHFFAPSSAGPSTGQSFRSRALRASLRVLCVKPYAFVHAGPTARCFSRRFGLSPGRHPRHRDPPRFCRPKRGNGGRLRRGWMMKFGDIPSGGAQAAGPKRRGKCPPWPICHGSLGRRGGAAKLVPANPEIPRRKPVPAWTGKIGQTGFQRRPNHQTGAAGWMAAERNSFHPCPESPTIGADTSAIGKCRFKAIREMSGSPLEILGGAGFWTPTED